MFLHIFYFRIIRAEKEETFNVEGDLRWIRLKILCYKMHFITVSTIIAYARTLTQLLREIFVGFWFWLAI